MTSIIRRTRSIARSSWLAALLGLVFAVPAACAQESKNDPPPLRTVTWKCEGNVEIVTTFLEGDPPTVRVEFGDSVWSLPLTRAASGSKYTNGTVTLWTHGDEATFESPNLNTRCVFVDPASSTKTSLEGTSWRLIAYDRDGTRREMPEGVAIDATFENGRVTGRGVCNRYFASYTLGVNQALDVGDVGATMMMCPDHYDIESAYFRSLNESSRFAIDGDILTITTSSGSLTFGVAP